MSTYAKIITEYKKSEKYKNLKLYINLPVDIRDNRTCMIFFHGAGFTTNKVNASQFSQQADYFANKGIVTICAEYRPLDIDGLFSPIESLYNSKSAIRWIRENSKELRVSPNKVIVVGASAGGYLCLCCGMLEQFNDCCDDISISSKPDAAVIFNGGVDSEILINLFPELKSELQAASPIRYMEVKLPPSIFFHGTCDINIPIKDVINFVEISKSNGNVVKLVPFEGMEHGFFNYGRHDNKPYEETLKGIEEFLNEINF